MADSLLAVVIQNLAPLLLGFPILLAMAAIIKSSRFKGWIGEKLVSILIKWRFPADDYHQYDDVTIPDGEGTTQVDHILVSRFGVFVIETKHMRGWIFGREHDRHWTQTFYKKKIRFQNPIRQNYKHTKTLECLLGMPAAHLHAVVVFTGAARLKTKMPPNVCNLGSVDRYIKSFTQEILAEGEVQWSCRAIEQGRFAKTRDTHREHVEQLRRRRGDKAQ